MDQGNGDIASLFFDDKDGPDAQNALRLAAALRGQTALGQLGQMTGNKNLMNIGGGILQGVSDQNALIAKAGSQIRQQGLQLSMAKQEQDAAAVRQQESDRAAMNRTQAQINATKFVGNPYGVVDQKTGKFTPYPAGEGKPAAGGLTEKQLDNDFTKFGDAISPVRGRGSLNKGYQTRIDSAEQLDALLHNAGGGIINATPQQVREAGTALAKLISSGAMSEHQIEELTPSSFAGQWANLKQKVMNEPQGSDAQGFLQNMLETAARETNLAKQQLRNGQLTAVPGFAHLRKVDKARFDAMLQAVKIDPASVDDNGLEIKAAAHPQADAAAKWAAANPNDPRAKAILAKLSGGP